MTHKINFDKVKQEKKEAHMGNVMDSYGTKLSKKVDKANQLQNKIMMMEQKESDML